MANWRENLEKLRGWIDGERQSDISENVIKAHGKQICIGIVFAKTVKFD